MIRSVYRDQVDLLLEVLPSVLDDSSLALKGGTAINLFIMNMPRLSVDIDLTFTKVTDRLQFQKDIIEVFDGFQKRLKAYTLEIFKTNDGIPKQARISNRQSQIKIDLNLILRGTVFSTK
jgi:predicted nucleotidyltransferase component of viral defense system